MKSQILLHIVMVNEVQNKQVETEEYITDLFIYTITPKHNYLFTKKTQELHKVNHQNKTLSKIDEDSNLTSQIKQLKGMFSFINIDKKRLDDKQQEYFIEGKGNSVTLNSKVSTVVVNNLELTTNYLFFKKNQQSSIFELDLPNNELVIENSIEMNIQGNNIITKSKVKSYEFIDDNVSLFDYVYNYKIL